MTTEDFISELFYRIDEAMKDIPKHPLASLWPSEVVTVGVLFALKGVGTRAFYRWLSRDWRPLFPASARTHSPLSALGNSPRVDRRLSGHPLGLGRGGQLWD